MRWTTDDGAAGTQADYRRCEPRSGGGMPSFASSVESLVQGELLPRIVRARRGNGPKAEAGAKRSLFRSRDIDEFADVAVRRGTDALLILVARARARGIALEAIYLELMQPAARKLNDRWAADTCDFASITLGLCHMHAVLRRLGPEFQCESAGSRCRHNVLLIPASGEQHTFGLTMLGEFLRRDGWIVTSGPFASLRDLGNAVRTDWLTLVGFSLSCDAGLDRLAAQITSVRRLSRNRAVWVLVGGRVFLDRPELVSRVGADATARDAKEAIAVGRRLAATPVEYRV